MGASLATNPSLAQRILGKGLTLEPEQAIGWFNLGIDSSAAKISEAIKAYQHCLSLPHSADTGVAARNNLSQDLLLYGEWEQGWNFYNQRFQRKPGNYPIFADTFGAAHTAIPSLDRPVLLMSEQGLGDTLQFVRYALALQNQGVDVTVLSQSPLVELLREETGLRKVDDHLDLEEQQQRNPVWLPLMNLAPLMSRLNQNIPFTGGYLRANTVLTAEWQKRLQRRPNPSTNCSTLARKS